MNAVIDAVLPVFALIGIGALAAQRGILGPAVTDGLNLFVLRLALPALLFGGTARMGWADIDHPGFILAYGGGIAGTFALSLILDRRSGQSLADRAIAGLSAAYGNTGFLGVPLVLALFGDALLPALVIGMLFVACVLFGFAIVLIEVDAAATQAAAASRARATLRALRPLSRNPLLLAPLAGGLWAATGQALPLPVDRCVGLLAAAAAPCALVTIGLFLAGSGDAGGSRASTPAVVRLVALKLVAQPLMTVLIARLAPMPAPWFDTALLLAALPTGTGPFMLAKLYGRDAGSASRVILVSTVLSVATVSALVVWIGR